MWLGSGGGIIHCSVGVQTCWKTRTSEDEYVLGVNFSMELKVIICWDGRRKSHRIVSIGGFVNTVVESSISINNIDNQLDAIITVY